MKIKYSEKILSDDHAFGFILNALETQRVEQLGRRIWKVQMLQQFILANMRWK